MLEVMHTFSVQYAIPLLIMGLTAANISANVSVKTPAGSLFLINLVNQVVQCSFR